MPSHLFVYGTLRRGSNNQFARLVFEQAQFVDVARVAGRLYDFDRYPGARRLAGSNEGPATESIAGEVFRLNDSSKLLDTLDDYEGADFERAVTSASLNDGRAIDCWIYWYVGAAAGRLIASGDWFDR